MVLAGYVNHVQNISDAAKMVTKSNIKIEN